MAYKIACEPFSSRSSIPRWNHDVFLSFIEDTSNKIFIDGLYNDLVQRGIRTCRDDDEHKQVENPIEESRIAIVVFSIKYIFSIHSLDQLLQILECRSRSRLTILPVFYDVDPSHVRKQTGGLEEAFARHGEHFKEEKEKVERWKAGLTKAANLSGWDLSKASNGHETKFVQQIVEEVLTKLKWRPLDVADYLVGIDSRVEELEVLLNLSSYDVRIVGICGIGGSGKTTIAKSVYNEIFNEFEGCCFLKNVGEVSKQPNGLIHLQEQLLADVLMKKNLKISNIDRGINVIKQRLYCKRVLVILDDVDQSDQLYALAIRHNSFGMGSRIIITSRNEPLLNEPDVDGIYRPRELDLEESLQLFSWHAFRKYYPVDDYMEISKDVLGYIKGNPLALEVLGSFLFDKRSLPEWRDALAKLKRIPHNQIQEKLKLSFDALDDTEKDIFLDIACFFIGMEVDCVIKILDGCDFFPDIGISVLTRRSLIIIRSQKLVMHDLIRDMGREIVRQESPKEPERRTRLWSREDVCDVLAKHKGTKSVEGLILNAFDFEDMSFDVKAFVTMDRMRLLQLNHVHLRGGYEHLFKKLRWLCWHGFPLNSIPTNFNMEKLVVLDMQHSYMKEVWEEIKVLKRLKILNLSHSCYLTKTPNFSGLLNLEELILEGCRRLIKVHPSIGLLQKLVILNLKDCNNLLNLPSSICKLGSLRRLNLSGCSQSTQLQSKSWFSFFQYWGSLRRKPEPITLLPASLSGLCSLRDLNLSNCNLSEDMIPNDFRSLSSSLAELDLTGNRFFTLPASICHLSRLGCISLNDCRNLQVIPNLPPRLRTLNIEECTSLEELPANISDLFQLDFLELDGCSRLQSFPDFPSSLSQLSSYGCTSLKELNMRSLSSLERLHIDYDIFCSLSNEINHFSKLKTLALEGSKRHQSFPKLPSSLECLILEGDTSMLPNKSRDIPCPETSQSVQDIHMEGCHHPGNTLRKKSLFQGVHWELEVWGSGSEIPEWIDHQNIGSKISFEVPPHPGCKINGLDVAAVFDNDVRLAVMANLLIYNKTEGIQLERWNRSYRNVFICQSTHALWVCYIPLSRLYGFFGAEVIEAHLEVGDQVEISVEIMTWKGRVDVEKCGVHLVHELDEEEIQSDNDRSLTQYMSVSNDDVAVDGEGPTVANMENENKRGYIEDVAESTIIPKD